ncbi:hypothetical protein CVT25_005195 [Psilocybe cyanescens]|uniref:Uncharacterized protein n=1 Tax=Psilocybe cyanescens TaxID=93625 RepID=A0A409XDZ6_PSICY|nr:hypothetical protein CVT25_005195 [Psilocybe cyanescens]
MQSAFRHPNFSKTRVPRPEELAEPPRPFLVVTGGEVLEIFELVTDGEVVEVDGEEVKVFKSLIIGRQKIPIERLLTVPGFAVRYFFDFKSAKVYYTACWKAGNIHLLPPPSNLPPLDTPRFSRPAPSSSALKRKRMTSIETETSYTTPSHSNNEELSDTTPPAYILTPFLSPYLKKRRMTATEIAAATASQSHINDKEAIKEEEGTYDTPPPSYLLTNSVKNGKRRARDAAVPQTFPLFHLISPTMSVPASSSNVAVKASPLASPFLGSTPSERSATSSSNFSLQSRDTSESGSDSSSSSSSSKASELSPCLGRSPRYLEAKAILDEQFNCDGSWDPEVDPRWLDDAIRTVDCYATGMVSQFRKRTAGGISRYKVSQRS